MFKIKPVPIESTPFHTSVYAHQVRLESAGPATEWSRWSYIADLPRMLLRCDGADRVTKLHNSRGLVQQWNDPLEALRWTSIRTYPVESGPPFKGGWIGWISYDFGRIFEDLPVICKDDLHLPLFEFYYYDRVWALDRATNSAYFVYAFQDSVPLSPATGLALARVRWDGSVGYEFTSTLIQAAYEQAVQRSIDYITAGDIFQVNLSQRFSAPLLDSPHKIYERLQQESGATYGAFLNFHDHALISNSPELFLRVTPDPENRGAPGRIATRPIKGTRPNQPGMHHELLESIKDQAELNMIVDLERNDLGRICETGSVRVTTHREIESHPTVLHGVATIEGTLRDDVTFVDMLRATFPGGSITGAPKIRAMQIIEELEPVRRGPYCGAIGFLSNDGHIEFNLAIRTMIACDGQIHIPVGAGIVADSVPAMEYEETLVKAKAMFAALGIV